jgi:4,5-DOPA dioxygenase extradiol
MPVLGDPSQDGIVAELKRLAHDLVANYGKPSAIALVSAHYEEPSMTVGGAAAPSMIYDYGGFPPRSYKLQYPAKVHPVLAQRIAALVQQAGIACAVDETRGYDHGVFVPLMLMFPNADIPVVPVSVLRSQDPVEHMAVGRALRSLRDEGVLVLGSGATTHNFAFVDFQGRREGEVGHAFNTQLADVLGNVELGTAERQELASQFLHFHRAEEAQVRGKAEHFMPLFTVLGAANASAASAVSKVKMFNQLQTMFVFDD